MLPLKIRPKARADLVHIAARIEVENSEASRAFRLAVEQELQLLRVHPFLGRRRHFRTPSLRSWRVSHFADVEAFATRLTRAIEKEISAD